MILPKPITTKLFLFIVVLGLLSKPGLYSQVTDPNNITVSHPDSVPGKINITEYDTVFIIGDTIIVTDTVFVYIDRQNNLQWFAGFFVSPFQSVSQYNENGGHSNYTSEIENNTKNGLSNSWGANLELQTRKIVCQSGIQRTVFKEQFIHKLFEFGLDTIAFVIDTVDTYFIVNNIDTTWVYVTDTLWQTQNDSSLSESLLRNEIKYLEIPLLVGYQFTYNKLIFIPNTGVILGIFSSNTGRTIKPQDFSQTVEAGNSNFRKYVWSVYISTSIRYSINQNISFEVTPFYRYNLNSFYSTPYYYSHHRQSAGIRFGINVKL